MRPHPNIQQLGELEWLLPKWATVSQGIVQIGRVIYQNIQTTVLCRNPSKQRFYLIVVSMITAHRNAFSARSGNGSGRRAYSARELGISLV
ncbi:MAG: hypothetical protein ACJAZ0_000872 [Halioglobus sp.]|jgi:hypothetical protein